MLHGGGGSQTRLRSGQEAVGPQNISYIVIRSICRLQGRHAQHLTAIPLTHFPKGCWAQQRQRGFHVHEDDHRVSTGTEECPSLPLTETKDQTGTYP